MNFIYFGRLAQEKGFDLVIDALSEIVEKTSNLPGNIFIFGEGDMKKSLSETFGTTSYFQDCSLFSEEQLSETLEVLSSGKMDHELKIYFFGWQSQSLIRDFLKVSHFSLMPSRFLETFGLSALESLSEGVPVIGFQKGGLTPFILKELVIRFCTNDEENIEAMTNKIMEVSEKFSGDDWNTLSHESRRIADSYTEGRWIRQVQGILPEGTKKILLASDYTTLLGGIETHVQTIARVLRSYGYEVEIFGWNIPKSRWTQILRLLGLVYSFFNVSSVFYLRKKMQTFQPDVIWLHSVSRFLGPFVVREVTNSNVFSVITYHDLGLFSPFPSRVENEDMIPKHAGLVPFISTIHSGNPFVYIAMYCKYLQIYILRRLLGKVHIHFVPSAFLIPYVQNIIKIPEKNTGVLEHFL